MLHQLTLRLSPVNLSGAPLADDPHSVGSLNQVHFRGFILFSVSLSGLHFATQVKLTRAKIASAAVAVHASIRPSNSHLCEKQSLHATQVRGWVEDSLRFGTM